MQIFHPAGSGFVSHYLAAACRVPEGERCLLAYTPPHLPATLLIHPRSDAADVVNTAFPSTRAVFLC